MPIGYFKSVPKVDIHLEKESYRPGDELRVRVTVHTERPGMSVRRAVVELVIENRYAQTSMISMLDRKSLGVTAMGGRHGGVVGGMHRMASTTQRVTEERVDRVAIGRERLFTDGVIRHRTETFNLSFEIKKPPAMRTMERRTKYLISIHFDLPRMRDVEIHKTVPVDLT